MFTKFLDAIRTSIFGKRICYFPVGEMGINTPSRWHMNQFTPLVEDMLGLLLAPWIGSSVNSKSAYIINGTLNWY